MTLFSRLFGGENKRRKGAHRGNRLTIEALEDRSLPTAVTVVPVNGNVNNTSNFRFLQDAINAAGPGGTITIEPGATADFNIDITQPGLTIQGDPNVPSSILPGYNISIDANNVTLKNLNVNFVSVNPNFSGLTLFKSTVGSVFVSGGAAGNGNNNITQNYITGDVTVIGNTNLGLPTNDRITNNTFASFSDSLISVSADNGAVIQDNILNGGGAISTDTSGTSITKAPQTGIAINGGVNVTVANNQITLAGDNGTPGGTTGTFTGIAVNPFDPNSAGLPSGSPVAAPNVRILTNDIVTGRGTGLAIKAQAGTNGDQATQVLVQGNDFHNNLIGVSYNGAGGGSVISTDLGGGSLGSLGGNNFRGFTTKGVLTSAAIVLQNAGGDVLTARNNSFSSTVTPTNEVFAASGSIDVSQPLTNDQAYVQSLYTNFLGRTGAISELNFWVGVLNGGSNGRNDVVNGILKSDEGLGRVVDGFYIKYLGRQSDAGGRQYWVNLIKGGMTLEAVQAGFISSPEFISSNNSDYVQGLYRTFLGRTGTATELAYWYGQLPSVGLSGVALGFATSPENRNHYISDIYKDFLHRTANTSDLTFWSGQSGDLLAIEAQILATNEYFTKG
jgi:hypothetical protein